MRHGAKRAGLTASWDLFAAWFSSEVSQYSQSSTCLENTDAVNCVSEN